MTSDKWILSEPRNNTHETSCFLAKCASPSLLGQSFKKVPQKMSFPTHPARKTVIPRSQWWNHVASLLWLKQKYLCSWHPISSHPSCTTSATNLLGEHAWKYLISSDSSFLGRIAHLALSHFFFPTEKRPPSGSPLWGSTTVGSFSCYPFRKKPLGLFWAR